MALKIDSADFEGYETRPRMTPITARFEEPVSPYLLLLMERWKLIAAVTLVAIVAAFIYSKWIGTKWYQATAIIVPVSEGAVENRVEGGVGSLGAGGMASLLMSSGNDYQAQEYMTILRSFAFSVDLAMRHNMTSDLLGDDPADRPTGDRALKLKLFDALGGRFSVDYSIHAQNLSVHFVDRDPLVAQQMLGYYLEDLRMLRRREAIRSASAAIVSLEKAAKDTGDPLLSQQLYSLVAKQVQREKLAEVEADFAFRVLEPPIATDRPSWPRARIICFIALVLTPMLMGILIILFSRRRPQSGHIASAQGRPRAVGEHDGAF